MKSSPGIIKGQAAKPAPVPALVVRVYGLCDPLTGELKYIGKTVSPLYRRLAQHKLGRVAEGRGKAAWVRSLKAAGVAPEIFLLEECGANWREAERFYVDYFRSIGCQLLNKKRGGDGAEMTPELRAAIVERNKRRDPATFTRPPNRWRKRVAVSA